MKIIKNTIQNLKEMNLVSEAALLSDIEDDINKNNKDIAAKKLIILADTLDKKKIYRQADNIDRILKEAIYGFMSDEAEKENFRRDLNAEPLNNSGMTEPERDPQSGGLFGRYVKNKKNKLYYKIISDLQLKDGTVAAQFIENTISTLTVNEIKKIIMSKDCSIVDKNIYEGFDITRNNINLSPEVLDKVKGHSSEIARLVLGIPEGSYAKSLIDSKISDEFVYKVIDNLIKERITKKMREAICSKIKQLGFRDIIKELF